MPARLSDQAVQALGRIITGNPVERDKALSPYRTGPKLVQFFNRFGFDDRYPTAGGFDSRWAFAEGQIEKLNGSEHLAAVIEAAVDPSDFLDTSFDVEAAVAYLNRYLEYCDVRLVRHRKRFVVKPIGEPVVTTETTLRPREHASHEFIAEQIQKCDQKLQDGDYDGAITNSRSLVEAVLLDIESRLCPSPTSPPEYDGNLLALYKRTQRLLNLAPDRPGITEGLRQLLQGLSSVVVGLASLRNKLGDAHVRTYKPARHHAKLAVNAAKTLLDFIYDSFEYQTSKGLIKDSQPNGRP